MKKVLLLLFIVCIAVLPSFAKGKSEKASDSVITENSYFDPSQITEIQTDRSVLVSVKLNTSKSADLITKAMVDETVEEYKKRGVELTAEYAIQALVYQSLISQFLTPIAEQLTEDEINTIVVQSIIETASQLGYTVSTDKEAEEFISRLYGLSVNDYANAIMAQLLLESYIKENYTELFDSISAPTESEIRQVYEENKSLFNVEASARVAHIFMKFSNTQTENDSIYLKMLRLSNSINSGDITFEEAVSQYSEDSSSKQDGGLINGWLTNGSQVGLDQLGQKSLDEIFSLKVGQISSVVEGVSGYHIYKLVSLRTARQLDLNDYYDLNSQITVKDYIIGSLKQVSEEAAFAQAYEKLLEMLQNNAEITYSNSL